MLDPLDDFPIHQSAVSLAVNPMGLNAYDRYFFNGYSEDGSVFFAVAMGFYPNRGVADAAFSVVHEGRQHSVFTSGRMPTDRRNTRVGDIEISIDEPMHTFTIRVAHELISGEIVFERRSQPLEEPRFSNTTSGFGLFDYTRYTQFGSWTGSYTVDGEAVAVDGAVGCRDRSWGHRPVGPPPGSAPVMPQFFWLWAPLNFADGSAHFDVNDFADGSRWHDAGFLTTGLEAPEQVQSVDYEMPVAPGTRWAERATVVLRPWKGEARTIELEPMLRFQMKGLGYGHPQYRHGSWQADDFVDSESITLSEVDPGPRENHHVQQLVRATEGNRVGIGVLEVLVIGPHEPTGLTGLFDVKA